MTLHFQKEDWPWPSVLSSGYPCESMLRVTATQGDYADGRWHTRFEPLYTCRGPCSKHGDEAQEYDAKCGCHWTLVSIDIACHFRYGYKNATRV